MTPRAGDRVRGDGRTGRCVAIVGTDAVISLDAGGLWVLPLSRVVVVS